MFLGYSANSTTFRVYNLRSLMIMESVYVVFDDVTTVEWENDEEQKKATPSDASKDPSTESMNDTTTPSELTQEMITPNIHKNQSSSDVIRNVNEGKRTRGVKINFREMVQSACFISNIEPKTTPKHFRMSFGFKPCRRNLNSSSEMMYGGW